MKKYLPLVICLCLSINTFAQMKITSEGKVLVGTTTYGLNNQTGLLPGLTGPSANPDTLASMYVAGTGLMQSGAKIAFGQRGDVSIAESVYEGIGSTNKRGILTLTGRGGFVVNSNGNNIISYLVSGATNGNNQILMITPTVKAPQFLTTSDERMKTDISSLENVGEGLGSLSPISYRLSTNHFQSEDIMTINAANSAEIRPLQYGFLAQEVREVYPDLVFEDEEGALSIDYQGFIPILVDALKELQTKVNEQKLQIEELKKGMDLTFTNQLIPEGRLEQNRPNPFKTSTSIECFIPETAGNAFICIYDLNGNQKIRRGISDRGEVKVTIEANMLNAGMYIYALIIDGVEIDSKRMILTD